MNRQERRKRDREIDKDKEFVKKLSVSETKRMNEIIDKITKDKAEQAINFFISVLVTKGSTFKEIREVQNLMEEFMLDEKDKRKILEKENVDMTKLQMEVKEYMKGLIAQGKNRKEVIEETIFKFPKATKNMINRTFGEIDDEKVLDDAAAYILEDNKNIKKAIEKEDAKKIEAEVARQIEKESDDLEVLEEVVIKEVKLKGKNGVYEAKTGLGVALESEGYKLAFSNIEDLESFCNEFKKVFERI